MSNTPSVQPFDMQGHNWQPQQGPYIHCTGGCALIHPHGHRLADNQSLNKDKDGTWIIETLTPVT